MVGIILLACVAALQQDVDELIRQLSSNDAAVRDEATQKLKALGQKAVPSLEKVAKSKDKEAAARARFILRVFEVRESLTPNLLVTMPGVDERLASGDDPAWTQAFLEATAEDGGKRKYPTIRREDLEVLAARAVRGWDPLAKDRRFGTVLMRCDLRNAMPALVERLKDPRASVRRAVLYPLSGIGNPEAAKHMAGMLTDPDVNIRAAAAQRCGYGKVHEAVPTLVKLLEDPSESVRSAAVSALGYLKAKEAASAIKGLLDDRDPSVRGGAVMALGRLGFKEAVPRIRVLLGDHEVMRVRGMAAWALTKLRDAESANAIVSLLEGLGERETLNLTMALTVFKTPEVTRALLKLADSENDRIRRYVVWVLAKQGERKALPRIHAMLASKDVEQRAAGVAALGDMGAVEAVDRLVPLLKDEEPSVRWTAAWALRNIGATRAVPQLLELLDDEIDYVRMGAAAALAGLRAREAIPWLVKHVGLNSTIPKFLGELRAQEGIPTLVELLSEGAWVAAAYSAEALGKMQAKKAEADLLKALSHPSSMVRDYAAAALVRMGSREGVPAVLERERFALGGGLFGLNALRSAALWKRLRRASFTPRRGPDLRSELERLARELGLELELPGSFQGTFQWVLVPVSTPALEALQNLLNDGVNEVIFEPDRLRVVSRSEALKFWKAWWAEEQKKGR